MPGTEHKIRAIEEVARELGISPEHLAPRGRHVAKVALDAIDAGASGGSGEGALVLVSAMTPTRRGEGKTVTSIGLADALKAEGARASLALREPSVGPLLGAKGGATGGGEARVEPHQRIDLHFTGDLHALTTANNLLAALLDNHRYHGAEPRIDPTAVRLPRCLDVDDRQLRHVVTGLGGPGDGVPREDGFVITAGTELMAILALTSGFEDIKQRISRTVLADDAAGDPVRVADVGGAGAAAALMRDAVMPNLVQTGEGTPAIVHAGPFANLSTGHNSVLADRLALASSEVVVTEAGFGSDLGLDHMMHLVCPILGTLPSVVVLVATVDALEHHGQDAGPDETALQAGLANLEHHLAIVDAFGLPAVVAVNRFPDDTDAEIQAVVEHCRAQGVPAEVHTCYREGGSGGQALAQAVLETLKTGDGAPRPLVQPATPIRETVATIARDIYGADGVTWTPAAEASLERLRGLGADKLPVCIAKTPASLSDDPDRRGVPKGWELTVRDLELYAGAGYVVALAGRIHRMPGMGATPRALDVDAAPDGTITGL